MKIKVLALAYLLRESPGKEIILFFQFFLCLYVGCKICFSYGYFMEYEPFMDDLNSVHLLVSLIAFLIIYSIDKKIGEIVLSEDFVTVDMYDYDLDQIPNTEVDVIKLQWQGGKTYKIWVKGNVYTTKLKDRELQLFYDQIDQNKLKLKIIHRGSKTINMIKKFLVKYNVKF